MYAYHWNYSRRFQKLTPMVYFFIYSKNESVNYKKLIPSITRSSYIPRAQNVFSQLSWIIFVDLVTTSILNHFHYFVHFTFGRNWTLKWTKLNQKCVRRYAYQQFTFKDATTYWVTSFEKNGSWNVENDVCEIRKKSSSLCIVSRLP